MKKTYKQKKILFKSKKVLFSLLFRSGDYLVHSSLFRNDYLRRQKKNLMLFTYKVGGKATSKAVLGP